MASSRGKPAPAFHSSSRAASSASVNRPAGYRSLNTRRVSVFLTRIAPLCFNHCATRCSASGLTADGGEAGSLAAFISTRTPWGRERLIYSNFVTERCRPILLKYNAKQIQEVCQHLRRLSLAHKKTRQATGFLFAGFQPLAGAGCCWVRQWMLPPPRSISRPGIMTTSWSGNTLPRIALASASAGSSKLGAMMPPLTIRKLT